MEASLELFCAAYTALTLPILIFLIWAYFFGVNTNALWQDLEES